MPPMICRPGASARMVIVAARLAAEAITLDTASQEQNNATSHRRKKLPVRCERAIARGTSNPEFEDVGVQFVWSMALIGNDALFDLGSGQNFSCYDDVAR
jgi:hypothetical protein